MWTTKILLSGLKAIAANSFFSTSFTYLIVGRAKVIVYNFYFYSRMMKLTLTLLKMRNDILKATIIHMSVNKKLSFNNRNISSLSSIEKEAITIPKISRRLLSIFLAPTSVFQIWRLSFFAKLGYIALILLL